MFKHNHSEAKSTRVTTIAEVFRYLRDTEDIWGVYPRPCNLIHVHSFRRQEEIKLDSVFAPEEEKDPAEEARRERLERAIDFME